MSWFPSWLLPVPAPSTDTEDAIRVEVTAIRPSSPASVSSPSSSVSSSIILDDLQKFEKDDDDSGPMMAIPLTGFMLGFGAGLYGGAKRSSLVFMAENAHRRPETVQGWYFYNKTKNYRVLLNGCTTGFKTGSKVGMWTLAFVGIEYGITKLQQDQARINGVNMAEHSARWIASGLAGLGIASGASLLYRLSGPIARRAILVGTVAGTSIGALRDLQHSVAHGKAVEEQ